MAQAITPFVISSRFFSVAFSRDCAQFLAHASSDGRRVPTMSLAASCPGPMIMSPISYANPSRVRKLPLHDLNLADHLGKEGLVAIVWRLANMGGVAFSRRHHLELVSLP